MSDLFLFELHPGRAVDDLKVNTTGHDNGNGED
jgi:hypothetical protein